MSIKALVKNFNMAELLVVVNVKRHRDVKNALKFDFSIIPNCQ